MFLVSNLKKPKENFCFCSVIALGVLLAILGTILAQNGSLGDLLVILGTILRGILYIHKLPINRKAADTCNTELPIRKLARDWKLFHIVCEWECQASE